MAEYEAHAKKYLSILLFRFWRTPAYPQQILQQAFQFYYLDSGHAEGVQNGWKGAHFQFYYLDSVAWEVRVRELLMALTFNSII